MNLNNGEGKIIEKDKQKIGTYKDDSGTLFAVGPNCTFEGCLVGWSQAEKKYICPCCGSRYNYDGKVINGPATEELRKINL